MFPTLTPAQIARVAAHGSTRAVRKGEVLVETGDQPVPFFILKSGQIEIIRVSSDDETLVAVHNPGAFTGEANMLLGRPALMRARVSEPGEVIQLTREDMLTFVQTDTEIGDIVMRGFVYRRLELIAQIRHLFLMTGAIPNTAWLNGCVALDAKGFVKTGNQLTPEDLAAARWPLPRSPYLFETSLPGVFAVGDVRSGSMKRVASAVGEGSAAISLVHQVLAE